MDLIVYAQVIAATAIPVALVTAVIGVVVRKSGLSAKRPNLRFVIVGTLVPALMLLYGFYLSWPLPWYQPDVMSDIAPGPWLISASYPCWLLCLLISRRVFARPITS